jgi:hypothetical protein
MQRFLDAVQMPLGIQKNQAVFKVLTNIPKAFKPWFLEFLGEFLRVTSSDATPSRWSSPR